MTKPKILVSGATGKTGHAVVVELVRAGWPVRAVVHVRDARSRQLEQLGAELAVADLFDPAAVREAMAGARRAYWCPPFHPRMLEAAKVFADAAREAKLEAVVGLSQWLSSPTHPSLATRQTWEADRLLSAVPGLAYTTVNPGFFADNYLRLIGFAAQLGVLPSLTGDSSNAPPSNEDIARVVVAALGDPALHGGRSYRPTGPELLDTTGMAAILGKVLGRKVRRMEMPMWLFMKAARMQGVGAYELSGCRYYVEDHKQGAFACGAPNDVVLELTGKPPEDFATIARRYAERPEAARSFARTLRAWADFMRTPFMPGHDVRVFDRVKQTPMPALPQLAMANDAWLVAHGGRARASGRPQLGSLEGRAQS